MLTSDLIDRLIADVKPVQTLRSPWVRASLWLLSAAPYVATVVAMMTLRSDWASKMSDPIFLIEQFAALATAFLAAVAAFAITIPGVSRKVCIWPLIPLTIWLGSIGSGCIDSILADGLAGLKLRAGWACIPGIAIVGAFPAIAIVFMLRRGVPLWPSATAALAGLATGALGNVGLRMFHAQEASLMILVWQFGTVCALMIAAAAVGRILFKWPKPLITLPREAD